MSNVLPEWLMNYVERQDAKRAYAVNEVIVSLTDRELALVKEVAVMGYVQGMRHPQDEKIPGDATIILRVVEACLAFTDLYPAINAYPEAQR
jgi:hypothetical protein